MCPYKQNDNGHTMTCDLLKQMGGPEVLAGSNRPSYLCTRCQAEWTTLPTKENPPPILSKVLEANKDKPGLIQMGVNLVKSVVKQVSNGLPITPPNEKKIRLSICDTCEFNDNGRCLDCGCFIEEKSGWATADCGKGKWPKNIYTGKGGCKSCNKT